MNYIPSLVGGTCLYRFGSLGTLIYTFFLYQHFFLTCKSLPSLYLNFLILSMKRLKLLTSKVSFKPFPPTSTTRCVKRIYLFSQLLEAMSSHSKQIPTVIFSMNPRDMAELDTRSRAPDLIWLSQTQIQQRTRHLSPQIATLQGMWLLSVLLCLQCLFLQSTKSIALHPRSPLGKPRESLKLADTSASLTGM